MSKAHYLWYTDLHLNRLMPWSLVSFIRHIRNENPQGIFLTGDISNGLLTCFHLKLLATFIKCPIYFVLGNHDYYFSSFERKHTQIREMCKAYPNLIWLTDSDVIEISADTALVGEIGWYDCRRGEPKYLNLATDFYMIEDFRKLSSMKNKIELCRQFANETSIKLEKKLNTAISQGYKTIYILTHVPPWQEATRCKGSFLEKYYLPYNTNIQLGQTLDRVMQNYPHQDINVLAGHTHEPEYIRVSKNINCQVGAPQQLHAPYSQRIFI